MVVPEINMGQVVMEVERCAGGQCAVKHIGHCGGGVHNPQKICDAIVEAVR